MSTENIKLFFDKVEADANLQQAIAELPREDRKLAIEALVKLSEEAGVPFTAEELLHSLSSNGEISDSQLEGVAGGSMLSMIAKKHFGIPKSDLLFG